MLEYEINQPDKSDSDESARSLDREFGVPIMRTPDVKKVPTLINKKL